MRIVAACAALVFCSGCRAASTPSAARTVPDHGVIGVDAALLAPDFWVSRAPDADRVILTPDAITRQNRALFERDSSVYDLERLPERLPAATVRGWIAALSRAPSRTLWDERGDSVPAARIAELVSALALDAVADGQAPRFGLVVRRADLRTFPTTQRVFSSRGNTDIDRWQETALFPGTPVAVVHQSGDGRWYFVVSPRYAAWVEAARVATGPRDVVLGYGRKEPFLVVTGATVHTVFNPEQPAVSELQLDMGTRVPLLTDWPPDRPVHGQHPYTGLVVELPVRGADGALTLAPALLPRTADVSRGYLPLTQQALLRQAFKFLGERYGWGHGYNARDCSGFISDVYHVFGVEMPRNTGDQAVSPAFDKTVFSSADSHAVRMAALERAQPGDLLFIPGHAMMVIGHYNGELYIIHDTTGLTYLAADGTVVSVSLNGVVVTPLYALAAGRDATRVDRISSIVRVR